MITLPSKVSRGDELTAAWANKVVDTLASLRPMAGEGTRVSQTPGGFIVSSSVPFQKKILPFDILLSVNDSGHDQITLWPGTVNGILPSNILIPQTIDTTQDVYITVKCTATNGVVNAVEIKTNTVAPAVQQPTANNPPADFSILVGVIIKDISYNLLARNWINATSSLAYNAVDQPNTPPVPFYVWTW
jgi:hypothetical protein